MSTPSPTPPPVVSDDIQAYPYTMPSIAMGMGYYVLTMVSYCYMDDIKPQRTSGIMKLTTLFDLIVAAFYFTVAYNLAVFLAEKDTLTGIEIPTTPDVRWWMHLHIFSNGLRLFDTMYIVWRSDRSRVTYAMLLHNTTIFTLWAIVLDNEAVFYYDATCVFIAMILSLIYATVYLYWSAATWQRCIVPGAHIATVTEVMLYCMLMLHSGTSFYYAAVDLAESRMLSIGLWFGHHLGMMLLVMRMLWKRRNGYCCSSSSEGSLGFAQPTVGGSEVPMV